MLWKAFLNRVFLFTNELHTETPAFRAVVSILNKTKPTYVATSIALPPHWVFKFLTHFSPTGLFVTST